MEQYSWKVLIKSVIAEAKARKGPYWAHYGPTRMFIHNTITSKYFDLAIAAVIGVNVISMALEFYMMPPSLKYILKALNYFFTSVFTLEAIMKLAALGCRKYFEETYVNATFIYLFFTMRVKIIQLF